MVISYGSWPNDAPCYEVRRFGKSIWNCGVSAKAIAFPQLGLTVLKMQIRSQEAFTSGR